MRLFGIYGASGFGREVMPVARQNLKQLYPGGGAELVFIDDSPASSKVNGHRVLTFEQWMAEDAEEKRVSVAVGDPIVRKKLVDRCRQNGVGFFSVLASNAQVMDCNRIGDGAILCPFVTVTSNAKIGGHFHANIYSYVAHDCVIGDFVTFAPRVNCNGNVVIEDYAYIGTGAVLKQGRPDRPLVIGRGAVVGMGAVVTKDVPPGVTVVGNPARPLSR